MAKVEKLFQKPKVKKLDILTEDINTFVEIFPDLDVTHSKNRIEIDLSDNMTLEPEFGEKPISRFVEEIYVYKGEDENNNKIFILEYLTTEGLFGYIDEPEVVEEEEELDNENAEILSIKIENVETECDWIENSVIKNVFWYVIPTVNLKLTAQIVPYIIQNINEI